MHKIHKVSPGAGTLHSFHWPLSGASASRTAPSTAGLVTAQLLLSPCPSLGQVSAGPFPSHFCFHGSTHGQAMCPRSPGAPGWLRSLLSLQAISFCAKQSSHCCKVCRTPSGDTPELKYPIHIFLHFTHSITFDLLRGFKSHFYTKTFRA